MFTQSKIDEQDSSLFTLIVFKVSTPMTRNNIDLSYLCLHGTKPEDARLYNKVETEWNASSLL